MRDASIGDDAPVRAADYLRLALLAAIWGWLFLGEALPANALAGGVLILGGTILVTRG